VCVCVCCVRVYVLTRGREGGATEEAGAAIPDVLPPLNPDFTRMLTSMQSKSNGAFDTQQQQQQQGERRHQQQGGSGVLKSASNSSLYTEDEHDAACSSRTNVSNAKKPHSKSTGDNKMWDGAGKNLNPKTPTLNPEVQEYEHREASAYLNPERLKHPKSETGNGEQAKEPECGAPAEPTETLNLKP
jgi:hypothetical protein